MSKTQIAIFETTSGLIGFGVFWYATSFLAALGLFICLFANNVGHSRKL